MRSSSACAAFLLVLLLVPLVASADQERGSVTYATSSPGGTSYQVLSWFAGGPGITILQDESRDDPAGPGTAVAWYFGKADGHVARFLVRPGEGAVEELPAYLGARRRPLSFSEAAVLEIDPAAVPEMVSVPAGTFPCLHATVGEVELFVSDDVPRGLVKMIDEGAVTVELLSISDQAVSLLPEPAPTPIYGAQSDQLPLGRR